MDNDENKKDESYYNNIGRSSKEELLKRREDYQKSTDNKYKKRDYVRSEFTVNESGCVEHIWVWVLSVDEKRKTISGKLSNDPLHEDANIKYGSIVTVSFDMIESLIPHTYNASEN